MRAAAWSSSREDQFTLFQDADGGEDGDASGDDGLGAGAIAGIVVGGVAAVVIVIALAWWFLRRRRLQKQDMSMGKHMGPASPYQGMTLFLFLLYLRGLYANGCRLALRQSQGNSCRCKYRVPLYRITRAQQHALITAIAVGVWASCIGAIFRRHGCATSV